MAAAADLSGGLEPVAVALWPPAAAPPAFQYSPDSVAGADGDTDPTEITFPGCSCLTSSCVVHVCSCLCHGENYSNLCIKPTDEEEYARPIFECNAMCQCGEACQNRVVQRGLQFRLEVFKTVKKGWGLRTLEFIAKGRFVCEYAGEVLGFNEARRRIQAQTSKDSNYIIAVREHLHNGQIMETFVDPTYIGNVGRFLNHSCEPNLFMVPVRVDSMVPKLALFAATDISAGEELSYDYSGRFHNLPVTNREQKTSEEEPNSIKQGAVLSQQTEKVIASSSFLCRANILTLPTTLQKALSKEEQVSHQKKHISGHDFHCNRNVTEVATLAAPVLVVVKTGRPTSSYNGQLRLPGGY